MSTPKTNTWRTILALLVLCGALGVHFWSQHRAAEQRAIDDDLREPDFVTRDGRVVPKSKPKRYPDGQPPFLTEKGDPIPESELADRLAKGEAFGSTDEKYLVREPSGKIVRVDGGEIPNALAAGCTILSPREGRLFQEQE
jgi:hypothetical protein